MEDSHSRGKAEDPHLLQRDIQTAVGRNLGGQERGETVMEGMEIGVQDQLRGGIAMMVPGLLREEKVLVTIGVEVTETEQESTIEGEIMEGAVVTESIEVEILVGVVVEVKTLEDIPRPEGLIVIKYLVPETVTRTPGTQDIPNTAGTCMGFQAVGPRVEGAMEGGTRKLSIGMDLQLLLVM